jgi:hypothetical protein
MDCTAAQTHQIVKQLRNFAGLPFTCIDFDAAAVLLLLGHHMCMVSPQYRCRLANSVLLSIA